MIGHPGTIGALVISALLATPARATDYSSIHIATATSTAPSPVAAPARAALLIQNPGDPEKLRVAIGTVVWTIVPPASGHSKQAGPSVRADIEIPETKMHATVTICKNVDANLPATHTIALNVTFADGAKIEGFKDMGLPEMRRDDTPRGDPFSAVRVKLSDKSFLVGLTASQADLGHNLEMLSGRDWLDFPLRLNNDHIAKLTIEKGAIGKNVVAQTIEAWK